MISDRHDRRLLIRHLILFVLLALLAWSLFSADYVIVPIILGLLAIIMMALILRQSRRTNEELARFFSSVRYADFSQSFTLNRVGSGFPELGESLNTLMQEFRDRRSEQEEQLRYLKALLEQVPLPLITVKHDGSIDVLNNAARRLFGTVSVTRDEDLSQFGDALHDAVMHQPPGQRCLVRLNSEDQTDQIALSVSELTVAGHKQRLISLANIQSELEATELEAWQQLVRVLTHEIMNSVTPIASLANTAGTLVRQSEQEYPDNEQLADIRDAVDTVATRSDRLMRFIQSYRSLTRVPSPKREPMRVADLFDEMIRLKKPDLEQADIAIDRAVSPESLAIDADPELIEQVMINLISNAAEALADRNNGRIDLLARLNRDGHVVLSVRDNGPGIADDLREKIFVPFFTTKTTGTGVGLALTRQIMRAHGNSVQMHQPEGGGAQINLVFR